MGGLASRVGLRQLVLPQPSAAAVLSLLGEPWQYATADDSDFSDLSQRLSRYFRGETVSFPDALDFGGASPFRCAVWEATCSIPYGQTRSYGWLARRMGEPRAVRAVGQALAANPLPIVVPCHRVIASDGRLGGYSGGIGMKKYLLIVEGSVSTFQVTS
ncbi:MAG: methylated-DNA--[protein]-cysteine S-methyltransferase [Chloroflexi bacterium]|nr:methylated-DNA--[protein]-cysteine S-methyltransferase [Chloroflexota bacterium]